MKRRPARLAVLTLALLSLMVTTSPPASATTYKYLVLTGNFQLGGGLGYPCTPFSNPPKTCPPNATTTVKVDGKNTTVNLSGGNHVSFSFASAACVKVSASVKAASIPGKHGPALCGVTASGSLWGWCGLGGGAGTMTITNQGVPPVVPSNKSTVSTAFKFIDVAGNWYITGGNQNANLHGIFNVWPAIHFLGGPNCLIKTGTTFTVTGTMIYKDLTI